MRRIVPAALVLLAFIFGLISCGISPPARTDQEEPSVLQDGSYSCDATNSTQGNGPYSLACEKSGDTLTIHFENGGYIHLDIDSQDKADENTWEIAGSNPANVDSWDVTVSR
jgi:hypothetical protein